MITVLETALPVFLAIAIGMWCRSKNFVTREGIDTLKKVIINLTLPFVLFNAFPGKEFLFPAEHTQKQCCQYRQRCFDHTNQGGHYLITPFCRMMLA